MADSSSEENPNPKPQNLHKSFSLLSIPNPEKPPLIFPPKNHENLHISTSPNPNPNLHSFTYPSPNSLTDTSSTSSSSSFSPSDDTSAPTSPIKSFENLDNSPPFRSWGLWNLGLESFTNKFNAFVTFLRSFGVVRGVLLIFNSPIAPLLVFLYFRWRLRRMVARDQHLIRLVSEKDERVNELLVQIGRMNEVVLLSMQKIPSSNVG